MVYSEIWDVKTDWVSKTKLLKSTNEKSHHANTLNASLKRKSDFGVLNF